MRWFGLNNLDKRNNVKIDYDLVAEQYAKDFGNYIDVSKKDGSFH